MFREKTFRTLEEIDLAVLNRELTPEEGEKLKTALAGSSNKVVYADVNIRANRRYEAHH